MNRTLKFLLVFIFSLVGVIIISFLLLGSVFYFADEIQGANWEKVSFYSCLIIAITWKLTEILRDLPGWIFKIINKK